MKTDSQTTIQQLKNEIIKFREDRDWRQFHQEKDLALDIMIEAGELAEHFLWKKPEEIEKIKQDKKKMREISNELVDVFWSCMQMADVLDVDLAQAFYAKLRQNEEKYPIEKCKGKSGKYTEL